MSRARKDEGAVLLTTLLVMSLMAVVAVSIIDDVKFAVKRASHVQSYAQADWYTQGATDFSQNFLNIFLAEVPAARRSIALHVPLSAKFDIYDGTISLTTRDGNQCVSLGAMETATGRRVFRELLVNLGWGQAEAAKLTSVAIDWQDADTQTLSGGAEDYTYLGRRPAYRTANTAFSSITELRELDQVTEKQYQRLRPFICARSANLPFKININTMTPEQAPLLAAVIGGDGALTVATQILTERPGGGFENMEAFRETPALASFSLKDSSLDVLTFEPEFIWIEATIQYREAVQHAAYEFHIDGVKVSRIYKGFGEEAFRPYLGKIPDER